jgi:hypothetical protein
VLQPAWLLCSASAAFPALRCGTSHLRTNRRPGIPTRPLRILWLGLSVADRHLWASTRKCSSPGTVRALLAQSRRAGHRRRPPSTAEGHARRRAASPCVRASHAAPFPFLPMQGPLQVQLCSCTHDGAGHQILSAASRPRRLTCRTATVTATATAGSPACTSSSAVR